MKDVVDQKFNNVSQQITSLEANIHKLNNDVKLCTNEAKKGKTAALDASTKVSEMKTLVTENRPFKEDEDVISVEKLNTVHQLDLPFHDYDSFKVFDDKCKNKESVEYSDMVRFYNLEC